MLPKGYIEGVPRVSHIVSYVYPFEGNSKIRFEQWLKDKGIDKDDYMEEAQSVGTRVHDGLEQYLLTGGIKKNECDEYLHGITFLNSIIERGFNLKPEVTILDLKNRFQGTVDLVEIDEANKEVYIYDYKTWGIAKNKWKLPNAHRKPYDKIKKVSLQLSLYADFYRSLGYKVMGLYAVWLHHSGHYIYEVDFLSKEEIDEIIEDFNNISIIDNDDMIIQLRKPTEAFGFVDVTIDLYKDKDKDKKEAISEGIKTIKGIAKLMEGNKLMEGKS